MTQTNDEMLALDDLSSPLPGSGLSPARYRVVVLSTTKEVIRVERLSASSDEEAYALAQTLGDGHAIELWDGARFIEHFNQNS